MLNNGITKRGEVAMMATSTPSSTIDNNGSGDYHAAVHSILESRRSSSSSSRRRRRSGTLSNSSSKLLEFAAKAVSVSPGHHSAVARRSHNSSLNSNVDDGDHNGVVDAVKSEGGSLINCLNNNNESDPPPSPSTTSGAASSSTPTTATTSAAVASPNKRGHSLSRRLLGRRGRSQQPRPQKQSLPSAAASAMMRSLSPSHFRYEKKDANNNGSQENENIVPGPNHEDVSVAVNGMSSLESSSAVKVNLIRQHQAPPPPFPLSVSEEAEAAVESAPPNNLAAADDDLGQKKPSSSSSRRHNNIHNESLRSSQISLLSHATASSLSINNNNKDNVKKNNKKKKSGMWNKMKNPWRKKDSGEQHLPKHPSPAASNDDNKKDEPTNQIIIRRHSPPTTNADESNRSGTTAATSASTQAPPSPPSPSPVYTTTSSSSRTAATLWNMIPNAHHDNKEGRHGDNIEGGGGGVIDLSNRSSDSHPSSSNNSSSDVHLAHQLDDSDIIPFRGEDADDAPWNPTMSLLVKTGQLDCIESDSEEDCEGSSFNLNHFEEKDEEEEEGLNNNDGRGRRNSSGSSSSKDDGGGRRNNSGSSSRRGNNNDENDELGNSNVHLFGEDDNDGEEEGYDHNNFEDDHDDDSSSREHHSDHHHDDDQQHDRRKHSHSTTESKGYNADDYMEIDQFCNQVATSYLKRKSLEGGACDVNSRGEISSRNCDESTLSKDESTLSKDRSVIQYRPLGGRSSGGGGGGGSVNNNAQATGGSSEGKEKKGHHHHLSIRSLGASIARRGRSRGRTRKNLKQNESSAARDELSPASSSSQTRKLDNKQHQHRSKSNKKSNTSTEETAADFDAIIASAEAQLHPPSPNSEQANSVVAQNNASSSSVRRSRSLFRRNLNIFSKSLTKRHHHQEEEGLHDERHPQQQSNMPQQQQRRGYSMDILQNRYDNHNQYNYNSSSNNGFTVPKKRQAQSLAPHHRRYRHSFSSSSSLEVSDFSINEKHHNRHVHHDHEKHKHHYRKRKKCLVCRQKIPHGEGIKYMDFYFCEGGGSCFQCAVCKRRLSQELVDEDEEGEEEEAVVSGVQIISSGRGSIVQCEECARALMSGRGGGVGGNRPSSYDESSYLKQSIHMEDLMASNDHDHHPQDNNNNNNRPMSPEEAGSVGRECLSAAAKRLAEKASVKLTLATTSNDDMSSDDDDNEENNEHLSTLYFTQNEDDRQQSRRSLRRHDSVEINDTMSTKVLYELDSDAFGNPNYDGYYCSVNNFNFEDNDGVLNQDTPRITSVSLPKLESDEIDGEVTSKLNIDLRWVDEDGESYDSDLDSGISVGSGGKYIRPKRCGPAMLSIEPFKSETITKETVMKVLRQTWEYEDEAEHVTYEFTFVVPFKKIYISWEIDEGDELDLTQCSLEVHVRYDPPVPEYAQEELTEVETGTEMETAAKESDQAIRVNSSTVNDPSPTRKKVLDLDHIDENGDDFDCDNSLDDHSMPNAVYVKTVSIDQTTVDSSTGPNNSLILSHPNGKKSRASLDPDRDENDNFSELLSVASCINSVIALPTITYLKIEKKEFDEEVGLSLIEKNGCTVVAEVSKSGLFADTRIKEGCEILAINGQCITGPRSVMRIMKDLVGKVTIMISDSPPPPEARFVVKKHKSTGFGRMTKEEEDILLETVNGLVRVRKVFDCGIFADSPISAGDIVLSVDGVPAVSDAVATRALGRSQYIVAMLMFPLASFWKSMVEFTIDEKYNRWWKRDNKCTLLLGNEDCAPITLIFDEKTGLCKAEGNEDNEIDLKYMNIIIARVMKLLADSIDTYRPGPSQPSNTASGSPNEKLPRVRENSRSMSVSASGKMKNRSDVYRRALIKLDEMRENGTLSAKDYEAGRHALAQVAIQTAT